MMTRPEDEVPSSSRRRFVRFAGTAGLAALVGCSSGEPTETPAEESTPTETRSPTQSPTATLTPTERPAEENCEATDPMPPQSDDEWWSMYLFDRYNSQYNRKTTGPTEAVGYAWRHWTGGEVRSSPAVVNESVYVGSNDGTLYSLDMVTGEQEWVFETGASIVSSPGVLDGTVYVGSNDHNVYALDAQTGEQEWVFESNGPVRSSPAVTDPEWYDDGLILIGSDDGKVYYLNATTGEKLLAAEFKGPVVTTPYVADWSPEPGQPGLWWHAGSTDSTGQNYGELMVPKEDASGFEFRYYWDYTPGSPIHSSFTARSDYSVNVAHFYGTDAGELRKFTEVNGDTPWRFETGGRIRGSPAMTRPPRILYFGSSDHNVYAVPYESGEAKWQYETDGPVRSSPAVADDVVYFGSGDHHVYALDAGSGEKLWNFRTGGAVHSSPAVVNETVFVGSDDGYIYALTTCQ